MVPVASLEFDRDLYPRIDVSEYHVSEIVRAMDGGHSLPPVIADRKTRKLVDGTHRWHAAIRKEVQEIAVEWRDYADEAEMFKDACLLNSAHGLNFTSRDRLKVIEIGQKFGLKDVDFSLLLRTSTSYVQAIMPRIANVPGNGGRIERVPLKASVRHLSGQTITPEQADAIKGNAPGTSYLLVARQLISAVEHDLLPPPDQHPVLWQELAKLAELLEPVPADT
jgi:ParB-like nuclease domain